MVNGWGDENSNGGIYKPTGIFVENLVLTPCVDSKALVLRVILASPHFERKRCPGK